MNTTSSADPEPLPELVRLVVLFGGQSAEHDVSLVTAAHVLRAVDLTRYRVVPIAISRSGDWRFADEVAALLAGGSAIGLPERLDDRGTAVDPLPTLRSPDDTVPTVVLPLLHGPHGEDGTVQGLLELTNLPYVGAGVLGSALAMDKAAAKDMVGAHGIPQCRWRSVTEERLDADWLDSCVAELGLPLFVKPANLGSSVGVSKAHSRDELETAAATALGYDRRIVVEEAVTAREIEIALLGNDRPECSVAGEIVPAAEFYDYADKYVDGAATTLIPAELPAGRYDELCKLAVRSWQALRCEGLARVDFFFEDPGRGWLLNEINTIPGFTPISMYPKLWEASGLSYTELIDRLVGLALQRHRIRSGRG